MRFGGEARTALLATLALILGIVAGWIPRVPGEESPGTLRIAEFRFRGLESVDSVDVATRIPLRPGDPYDQEKVAEAVRRLYALKVFSLIQVEREPLGDDQVRLIWTFHERPRLLFISFHGNEHFGDPDLQEKITLRVGQLLDRRRLEHDRRAIQEAYEEEGYPLAEVQTRLEPREGGVALIFQIREGPRAKVREIRFVGNEKVPDDKLADAIPLKKKSFFRKGRISREKIEESRQKIEEYYHRHGFRDARVRDVETEYLKGGEDVRVTFYVEEGPLYYFGRVAWEGAKVLDEKQLGRLSRIRRGEVYDSEKMQETLSEVYAAYTERGYLLGLYVDPATEVRADTVDVTFRVREGEPSHVRDVIIKGNTRTREYVIRREIELAPGDLLRRSVLVRSQRNIMALGFFEDVLVDYQPAGDGTDIDIIFEVKEKTTGTASAGAGFSSDTGLTGFLDLGHNNLFGRGQSIQLHLERGGRREDYRFSFTEPWLGGRPTSVGVDLYRTERILDIYTERRRGGSLRLGRPWFFSWPDFSRIYFSYTLEELEFADFGGLDETSINFLTSGAGTISQVAVTFRRNSTDNPFYPTVGGILNWRAQVAGGPLGGDLHFIKNILDVRHYFVPFWKPTLMLRFRMGHVTGIRAGDRIPGNETFRLGGTTYEYLRGYDDFYVVPEENIRYDEQGREERFPGGRFMFTFTAEYQFPIVSPLHGVLFFDTGNTWNAIDDFSLVGLKSGLGFGVRLEIPMLGRVGLDYAYGVELGRWRTHFILGPAF
jgi:outer membrane protein insertion porin family